MKPMVEDDEDDRGSQPCSCDDCGHVSCWDSVLVHNVFYFPNSRPPRVVTRFPLHCEQCGGISLRPGIILPAPRMTQ